MTKPAKPPAAPSRQYAALAAVLRDLMADCPPDALDEGLLRGHLATLNFTFHTLICGCLSSDGGVDPDGARLSLRAQARALDAIRTLNLMREEKI